MNNCHTHPASDVIFRDERKNNGKKIIAQKRRNNQMKTTLKRIYDFTYPQGARHLKDCSEAQSAQQKKSAKRHCLI